MINDKGFQTDRLYDEYDDAILFEEYSLLIGNKHDAYDAMIYRSVIRSMGRSDVCDAIATLVKELIA